VLRSALARRRCPAAASQQQALALSRDISAAPEEARALEGIGHSHLQAGNPSQAVAPLRQALRIYQRIGAPGAKRVQKLSAAQTCREAPNDVIRTS
jgi:predicted TPR repeat methyltransferase